MKPVAHSGSGRVAFRRFAALHFSLAEAASGRSSANDAGPEAIGQRLQTFQAATLLES